jgi:hypothetical protein
MKEEIFTLFNKWYENNYQIMILQIFIAIGSKPQDEALEEMKGLSQLISTFAILGVNDNSNHFNDGLR